MSKPLGTQANKNSFAGKLLTTFSPLVEGVTGRSINTFVTGSPKDGKTSGRAAQGSADRAAVEEFDRKLAAQRNAARGKTGSGKKDVQQNFPKPSTEPLPPGRWLVDEVQV